MKPRLAIFCIFLLLILFAWLPASKSMAEPASTATAAAPMNFQAWFTPPPTVNSPSQADQGAQTFFYICMVCHGDQGQGLDLWRQTLQPPDNNCWTSKCHAPNHMDFGFTFPHEVPPVKGPIMIAMFASATNLHDFLKESMPFQSPGSLTDDQYWQLTAFLLRLNGIDLGNQTLDAASAKTVFLQPKTATPMPAAAPGEGSSGLIWIVPGLIATIVVIAAMAIGLILRRQRA